jgi:simple sugar transport system ATP-binding protein
LLRLEGISKRFGIFTANEDISFSLMAGEIHAVVGENGAGKTTLMNILYGIYQADHGRLFFDGKQVSASSPAEAIKLGISLVSQHFLLVERHTVAENLALALPGLGFFFSLQQIERAMAPLKGEYGLDLDLKAKVASLSLGQRQRLEIAKALLRKSRIIILDEPTSVLSPPETEDLFAILKKIRSRGCGILFISHKLDEVLSISDRISILRRGRLVKTVAREDADKLQLTQAIVGSEVELPRRISGSGKKPERLRVDGLTLGVKTPPLSFAMARGEILGIAGIAGNGQAELAEALTGLRPTAGARIALDGEELGGKNATWFQQRGVAHIPEDRNHTGIVPSMSVEENFLLRWLHFKTFQKGPLLAWTTIRREVIRLIGEYQVSTPSPDTRAGLLSGGNVQKLILARELFSGPRLMVAMHPTYGLDVRAIAQVHQSFLDQAAQGTCILLISEDLDELFALADRVAVLFEKRWMGVLDREVADRHQLGRWMTGEGAA